MNPNFSTHAYLNNYLTKFRTKLPSENVSVQDLHAALNSINIKPENGTMYLRKDLEKALNFLPTLDMLRKTLHIPTSEDKKKLKQHNLPVTQKTFKNPQYFSSQEMQDASNELLMRDEVFNENKTIKLTEADIRQMIYECVKKIKESD